MGNGGWQSGLGAGLQGAGNTLMQFMQMQQRAKQDAVENALRQQQLEQQTAQQAAANQLTQRGQDITQGGQDRLTAQYLTENMPGGTSLPPEVRSFLEANKFGGFVKPDIAAGDMGQVAPVEGLQGAGPMGLAPSFTPGQAGTYDTGKGTSIPTENSSVRRAEIQAQAAMLRRNQTAMERQALQNQRLQAQAELQQARLKDPVRAQALQIQLQRLDLMEQELARKEKEDFDMSMYRWGVQAPLAQTGMDLRIHNANQGPRYIPITPTPDNNYQGFAPNPDRKPFVPTPPPAPGGATPPSSLNLNDFIKK
jgi:hypothetical protein